MIRISNFKRLSGVLKSCSSDTSLTRSAFFSLALLCLIQAGVWLRRTRGNCT